MTTPSGFVFAHGFGVTYAGAAPNLAHQSCYAAAWQIARLPTDPIGTFALELTNVVIGSRIHIETQGDGTTLHDSVADATSETISLSAYASGSAYNALRIKVRKGTGYPTYKPFETLATVIVGAQSIYVGQIADE